MTQALRKSAKGVSVQRDPLAFESAARHSRLVRVLKYGLLAIGAVGIGVLAGLTVFSGSEVPKVAVDLTSSAIKDGKIVMANPRMNGFTKDNKPYKMEAQRAVQDVSKTAEITLEKIGAVVPFRGEETARIAAESALYNSEKQTLSIDRPFTVRTTDGLNAALQGAFVELQAGTLVSDKPVSIEMNGTRVSAQSMKVLDRGKVLVFESKVQLNISPGTVKTAKAGSGELASEGNKP